MAIAVSRLGHSFAGQLKADRLRRGRLSTVEGEEDERPRKAVRRGEVEGVERSHPVDATDLRRPQQARSVDRHDEEPFPIGSQAPPLCCLDLLSKTRATEGDLCFGMRQVRRGPARILGHELQDELRPVFLDISFEECRGVEKEHQRSRCLRRICVVVLRPATGTGLAG